ncbi:MAG: hypothetical protein QM703_10465 [Gemmatales bacterium]
MFDVTTGTLTFEHPPVSIKPSLTRDEFLAGPLAVGAQTHVGNEPYHSWKLGQPFRSSGLDLLVVLWFHHQRLTMVSLMDANPRFGVSWDDYSLDKELARKASHDAWLLRSLPPEREYPWGNVWSGYDDKGGFSSIVVRYGCAGN